MEYEKEMAEIFRYLYFADTSRSRVASDEMKVRRFSDYRVIALLPREVVERLHLRVVSLTD